LCRIEASLLATLGLHSEFVGRLGIKLPCDWQILGPLKFANARPGPKTKHPIDFPAIMSFAPQRFLHSFDIVPMLDRRSCLAEAVFRS